MSEPSESPIISRLKDFMAYSQMTNSQFADYTGIPRPTLSQLLHGRNKSVNDQLIRKLHDSFPALNIVWLLFGKGEMLTEVNPEACEAHPPQSNVTREAKAIDNVNMVDARGIDSTNLFSMVNQIEDLRESHNEPKQSPDAGASFENRAKNQFQTRSEQGAEAAMAASLQSNQEKKISSIIVLYTDNSFETFLPV